MTDEELIARLRNQLEYYNSGGRFTAANRIEQLINEQNKLVSNYIVLLQEIEIQLEDAESVLKLLAEWDQCWPSNDVERAAREARRILLGEE